MSTSVNLFQTGSELGKAAILAGVLLVGGPVTGSADTHIQLQFATSTTVTDTVVTLGDVATVVGGPESLRDKLRGATLGAAAPAGYSRFVSASDAIAYRLRPQFPDISFTTKGASRVEVKTDFVEHSVSAFLPDIRAYLDREIAWGVGRWSVEFGDTATAWKTLRTPLSVSVSGLLNRYPKGNVSLTLCATQAGRTRRIPVPCHIRVTTPVLVARQAVARGAVIDPSLLELRTLDITHFGPSPYTAADQLDGMMAARSIAPGTIFHDRLVKAIPLVAKGDQVYIGLQQGSVRVSVPAVAREPGGKGERIWVENALTHRLIRATVTGKGAVSALCGGNNI